MWAGAVWPIALTQIILGLPFAGKFLLDALAVHIYPALNIVPYGVAVLRFNDGSADRHEYHITDDAIGVGTPGTRFNNNVRAIRLLKKLEKIVRGPAGCWRRSAPHRP